MSHLLSAAARDEHGVEGFPGVVGHFDFDVNDEDGLAADLGGRNDALHDEAYRLGVARLAFMNHTRRHPNAPVLMRLYDRLRFFCCCAESDAAFKALPQWQRLAEGQAGADQDGQTDD